MNKFFLTILLLMIAAAGAAQQPFSTVEEQMTGKEFNAAGLEKLTPDELSALNEWIRGLACHPGCRQASSNRQWG
jgi:hypothetical protein